MNKKLFSLHKWAGVSLFILFFIQGITGTIITHKEALTGWSYGTHIQDHTYEKASLDVTIDKLENLYPAYSLERIIYLKDKNTPLIARLKPNNGFWLAIVYINRTTGTPTSHGMLWQYPVQLAERVHVSLLSGIPGNAVILVEGILLTFMAISGLILWWPKKNRFANALKVKLNMGMKRLVRDLHVVPAVFIAPFMIVSAFSGALILSEELVAPAVGIFLPVGEEVELKLQDIERPQNPLSWQDGYAILEQNYDDSHIAQLRFPVTDRLLTAILFSDTLQNPKAHHIIGLDRYNGSIIEFENANTQEAGDAFMSWFLTVHAGAIYGPFRAIILTILGIILAGLAATGIIMWQQRRQ